MCFSQKHSPTIRWVGSVSWFVGCLFQYLDLQDCYEWIWLTSIPMFKWWDWKKNNKRAFGKEIGFVVLQAYGMPTHWKESTPMLCPSPVVEATWGYSSSSIHPSNVIKSKHFTIVEGTKRIRYKDWETMTFCAISDHVIRLTKTESFNAKSRESQALRSLLHSTIQYPKVGVNIVEIHVIS